MKELKKMMLQRAGVKGGGCREGEVKGGVKEVIRRLDD